MSEQQWARPFRITQPNGEVLDGVQFPSGRCVLDYNDPFSSRGFAMAATTYTKLDIIHPGAHVEWADGGQA